MLLISIYFLSCYVSSFDLFCRLFRSLFHWFLWIGESLGASVLTIVGGIFTKIADIGSDLMKIVFKVKEDDARNPGLLPIACSNAGDSVGPTATDLQTYGVTGIYLSPFILLAVKNPCIPGATFGLDFFHAFDHADFQRAGLLY